MNCLIQSCGCVEYEPSKSKDVCVCQHPLSIHMDDDTQAQLRNALKDLKHHRIAAKIQLEHITAIQDKLELLLKVTTE